VNVIDGLALVDHACVEAGMPAISEWWLITLRGFYDSAARELVLRVGRRGGKSSTLCRVAVAEALYGEHYVAPGDTAVVALIAQNRERAAELLVTLAAILDATKVEYRRTAGQIQLEGRALAFRVFTASIAGVSGATCICVICDEVAKWRDAETGANPAREVLGSVRPTMATIPRAKMFLSSSPLGSLDAHAAAFDRGDTSYQRVAFAPTWVAHPKLTEAWTRELEPNEDYWRREYAAIPTEGNSEGLLSASMLDAATRVGPELSRESGVSYVGAMDPGFTRNPWTFALAGQRWVEGRIKRSIVLVREWQGRSASPNDPRVVLAEVKTLCDAYGGAGVTTDQYEMHSLLAIANDIGLELAVNERGQSSRLGRYEALRTKFADREVEIPDDKRVRSDLLSIRQKLTPNGFTIDLPETPDGRHADFSPSIALAVELCNEPPKGGRSNGPPPGSQEWEDEAHKKRLARIDKRKAEGSIIVDDPEAYGPDPWRD
jgi:hypothetical protein